MLITKSNYLASISICDSNPKIVTTIAELIKKLNNRITSLLTKSDLII